MAPIFKSYDDEQCCSCGCWFGVPAGYTAQRRKDKQAFYCPNGHAQSYRESEADVLRRERDRLKQDAARLEEEARQARERAYKAEATASRLKKRAAAGTCPCCKRTFSNMAEHMKHQHPEIICEVGGSVVPLKRRAAQ